MAGKAGNLEFLRIMAAVSLSIPCGIPHATHKALYYLLLSPSETICEPFFNTRALILLFFWALILGPT